MITCIFKMSLLFRAMNLFMSFLDPIRFNRVTTVAKPVDPVVNLLPDS